MIKKPFIRTPLPGPNAAKIIALDAQYLSPSYTRDYPFVMHKGEGCWAEDVDGNIFLDFTAGIAVTSTGHCHPDVVTAIQEQAQAFLHMCAADFYYESQAILAKKLAGIAPGPEEKRVFLCNSGTEAIEAALKLAKYFTKRKQFIAFYGGFHGRTHGSLALTASKLKQKQDFFPFMPGVHHAPYPNPLNCPNHLTPNEYATHCIHWIEHTLFKQVVAPEEIAAVIVEPIQGEGGYIVPPQNFLAKLQTLCRKHQILLIADEIQSGLGRTGQWFASQHFGIEPDMIAVAKGIASGLPLGALITRASIMTWPKGAHASTFGGNPVACCAAITTLDLIEKEFLHNANVQGNYLQKKLKSLQTECSCIKEVRGIGLMQAIELDDPTSTLRQQLLVRCFENGLLLLGCGTNAVRFCPALSISPAEIDCAIHILRQSLQSLSPKVAS